MGESLVEAPKVENKMGESIAHVSCLQESVSFGRFEHDSLCWERWSTFPTNKYLEEVEKCSTPGSVAQKKAYFEAHYKKIAARKAELLDQEKRETESVNSEDRSQNMMGSVCNSSEGDLDVESSNSHNSSHRTELQNEVVDFMGKGGDPHFDDSCNGSDIIDGEIEVANNVDEHVDEQNDGDDVIEGESEVAREVIDHIDDPSGGIDIIDGENEVASEVIEHIDDPNGGFDTIDGENEVANVASEVASEDLVEPNDGVDIIIEGNKDLDTQVEDANEDLCPKMECPVVEKPKEPVLVKEEVAHMLVSQDEDNLPQDKVVIRETKKETEEVVKSETSKKLQKAMPQKKKTNITNAKKKPTSPMPKRTAASMPKSPVLATSKSSKPVISKPAISTTRASIKKENGLTPVTSKKATKPESKRAVPTSLHMSLSLGPAISDPALRKSLIMESMGDKDIVRRAFKVFQNFSQLSPPSLAKSPAVNEFATRKIEQKGSATNTIQKKNEGNTRAVKAAGPATGQLGTRKTALSPGSRKTVGVDQRNGKYAPASFGSRSQDQGNKQKEVSKKLEQKSKTKEASKSHLQSKGKDEKAAQIQKPSQTMNSKAKLSSSYNQGHGFLKRSLRKEDAKTKALS